MDLTYTLNVTNAGTSQISGVTLTVTLPAAVNFGSATASFIGSGPPTGTAAFLPPVVPEGTKRSDLLVRGLDGGGAAYLPGQLLASGGFAWIPSGVDPSVLLSQIGCDEAGGTVICALGILNSNERAIVIINVEPVEVGVLNNKAEAAYEGSEPGTGATKASESTTVVRAADLSLAKAETPAVPVPGRRHNYVYTVTNNGPSDASGVVLIDVLPLRATWGDTASGSIDCQEVGGIVECSLGSLPRGESITVTIPVAVDASVIGSMTNTVYVVANEADLDRSNNTVKETTSVNRAADLSVTKTYSPNLATEDNRLAYTLTIGNEGPSDASSVTLTDVLPKGLTFVSFTGGAQECGAKEDVVTCRIGNLAFGEKTTVVIVLAYKTSGTFTNTARVTAQEADPVPDNDEATETADVRFVPVALEPSAVAKSPVDSDTPAQSPTPTKIATPVETVRPETPEDRGVTSNWILLAIVIGGSILLGGGLSMIFMRIRRRY